MRQHTQTFHTSRIIIIINDNEIYFLESRTRVGRHLLDRQKDRKTERPKTGRTGRQRASFLFPACPLYEILCYQTTIAVHENSYMYEYFRIVHDLSFA